MTMLNQGLNQLRDLHYTDLDTGEMGTSGTAVAVTQTGLQVPISASEVTLTKTKAERANQVNYLLNSTTATGNTFREVTFQNSSDLEYDRGVFPGLAHTTSNEIVVIKTYNYRQ